MKKGYIFAKYACYTSNVSMSAIAALSPVLFMTFHELYGVSYTLLGLLVLVNFCTQLLVDLAFSAWSSKLPLQKILRMMPLLTILGLAIYALLPFFFPEQAYVFLVIGTVIFSASAGLAEVLTSPVIAALPSEHPERDMSLAHSVYAWGLAVAVLFNSVYLRIFSNVAWHGLALIWTLVPILAFVLFCCAELPPLQREPSEKETQQVQKASPFRNPCLWLCVACIFMGGAAENTMSQWCSGYLESAMGLPKLWGDVLGMAVFAVMLGLGRTLYAKYGRSISVVLLFGFLGAVVCYLIAGLTQQPLVGLFACALTGFCVSMLWPGTLIYTAELLPQTGVAVYALLAAGGDLGGSIAPQLVGIVTDAVAASAWAAQVAPNAEQLGFQIGMLTAAAFPLIGVPVVLMLRKREPNNKG